MDRGKGINRLNDYAFKRIFGSSEGKDVLLGFLNAVLQPPPGRELADVDLQSGCCTLAMWQGNNWRRLV
ncbi:MAG TPA: PD-(D/E)XK nuclease family transposase [Spirochaetia bacterium]|nr:PD-(D/E)XK nuclease family transposase [Spirochaetia bacterium]